mmetsp:Transcript_91082/g.260069  ORF Transcript_91082/g.260069 Transcript_91082/m.260069 type:complete len:221 (-) Transcript_91082:49-711(-)
MRHEDGHAVALDHPNGLERVGELVHLLVQLAVRVRLGLKLRLLVFLVALGIDGNLIAAAVGDLLVQGIVRQVGLAASEPLGVDVTLGAVEVEVESGLGVKRSPLPVELARNLGPERARIADRLGVHGVVVGHGVHVVAAVGLPGVRELDLGRRHVRRGRARFARRAREVGLRLRELAADERGDLLGRRQRHQKLEHRASHLPCVECLRVQARPRCWIPHE